MGQYNITSPEFKVNPFPILQAFREEASFARVEVPGGINAYVITRYDDVEAALKDPRFSSDMHVVMSPEIIAQIFSDTEFTDILLSCMLFKNPPDHTRLRSLINKAFTPRAIEKWADRIQAITEGLLAKLPEHGEVDLIEAFAYPLPMLVFSEILGVPPHDHQKFRRWADALTDAMGNPAKTHAIQPQMADFLQYIYLLIEEKLAHPAQDMISALIHVESEGSRLSQRELASMVILLLIAGTETTVNLISNGMFVLFQHPDQLARLKQDPTLIKSAIEEILRYRGPVMNATERWVQEDFEFRGQRFKKGDLVYISLASAGRDASRCPHAETFDIARKNNPHMTFGYGIHYCLGAPLARLEGQIAIHSLIQKYQSIRLNTSIDVLRWRSGSTTQGLTALPVAF